MSLNHADVVDALEEKLARKGFIVQTGFDPVTLNRVFWAEQHVYGKPLSKLWEGTTSTDDLAALLDAINKALDVVPDA